MRYRRTLIACGLSACVMHAAAQQDAADRLWQGTTLQQQQEQRQATPSPLGSDAEEVPPDEALLALPPHIRLQQLLFAILNAVNRRDWHSAENWLAAYRDIPQHDPSLIEFVAASRDAAEGRYREAVAGFERVLAANPLFARGSLDLARALYADHRLRDAENVFRELRQRPLPPQVEEHIDAYLAALARRQRVSLSLSVAGVFEDNVNRASTVVDACALVFMDVCLANRPGKEVSASGLYVEGALNKLWSLPGRHGVLWRSLGYGNRYGDEPDYNTLATTHYVGYQYATARYRLQLLPLYEYQQEGGRRIYEALGARAVLGYQWRPRTAFELNYEFKNRDFPGELRNFEGDSRRWTLFASHALRPDTLLYGSVAWHESDARMAVFAYDEQSARVGLYRAFTDAVLVNIAYSHRRKTAHETVAVFGRRQRDREDTYYLSMNFPALAWHGVTPSLSYEYRDNRSSIPHAYNYTKSRVTFGVNLVF